jgi:hypothetical protein
MPHGNTFLMPLGVAVMPKGLTRSTATPGRREPSNFTRAAQDGRATFNR